MMELTYALLVMQGVVIGLNVTSKTVVLNTTQGLVYLRVPYAIQCNGTSVWGLLRIGERVEVEGFQSPYGFFKVTKVKVGDTVCEFSKGRGAGQGQRPQKGLGRAIRANPSRFPAG